MLFEQDLLRRVKALEDRLDRLEKAQLAHAPQAERRRDMYPICTRCGKRPPAPGDEQCLVADCLNNQPRTPSPK